MPTFNLYPADSNKERTSISLSITHGAGARTKIKFGTGVSINYARKNWDFASQRVVRSYPKSTELNAKLQRILDEAIRLFDIAERLLNEDPFQYVRDNLRSSDVLRERKSAKQVVQQQPSTTTDDVASLDDILKCFDRFEKECSSVHAPATLKSYATAQNHLKSFVRSTKSASKFSEMTNEKWVSFRTYLVEQTSLNDNSARKTVKIIKTFLKWATERGYNSNMSYVKGLAIRNETQSFGLALTFEQLRALEALDLSTRPALAHARTQFLMMCATGLRHSDFAKLTPEHFVGDFIEIQPKKTRDHSIIIPISSLLRRIVENDPLWHRHRTSLQHLNGHLKTLGQLAGFVRPVTITTFKGSKRIETVLQEWEVLTSHCARRTFITIMDREGVSADLIMKLSGHRDHRSFQKYLKYNVEDLKNGIDKVWS